MFDNLCKSFLYLVVFDNNSEFLVQRKELMDVHEIIYKNLTDAIQKLCLRILILDIHMKNRDGYLAGETEQDKYYYYNTFWTNKAHIKDLCERYTEMYRLITQEILNKYISLEDMLMHLEVGKEDITKIFCDNKSFDNVVDLNLSMGDSHNGGKCAARIELDNGTVLYYKPHSLR